MRLILGAAFALSLFAGAASAATLTINFDDDGGTLVNDMGKKSYQVGGYIMDPVNIQGGLCADGSCTIESGQTIEPSLYREDLSQFDLYSFYFLNTGNGAANDGEPGDNFVELNLFAAFGDVAPTATYYFGNEMTFAEIQAQGLSIAYYDGEGSDPGSVAACFDEMICKNYGYVISMNGLGDGIGEAIWSAAGDANARLDDIVVSEVPLPAAGFLLLGGLGGLALMRRRSK